MPVTAIYLALNVGIGYIVLQSGLSPVAKTSVFILLLCEAVLFFVSNWMCGSEIIRKAGTAICIFLKLIIAVFGVVQLEYLLAGIIAFVLAVQVIWSLLVVFDFHLFR